MPNRAEPNGTLRLEDGTPSMEEHEDSWHDGSNEAAAHVALLALVGCVKGGNGSGSREAAAACSARAEHKNAEKEKEAGKEADLR